MPDARYPTLEEFWQRLGDRGVEPDLRAALRDRTTRPTASSGGRLPLDVLAAVAARLLPGATVPAEALAVFVDEHYDQQLGRADDAAGTLPRHELIPAGCSTLDQTARAQHGAGFADLDPDAQNALLAQAERGELAGGEGFDSATWFRRLRSLLFLAYGSDPRGMVEMGFPGPSYRTGHVWLDEGEVAARAARHRGYRIL